jgi:hypothetical protein
MQEPDGYVTGKVTKQLGKLIVVTSNKIVGIANRASLACFQAFRRRLEAGPCPGAASPANRIQLF